MSSLGSFDYLFIHGLVLGSFLADGLSDLPSLSIKLDSYKGLERCVGNYCHLSGHGWFMEELETIICTSSRFI